MIFLFVLLVTLVPTFGYQNCPKICYYCRCLLGEPGIDNYTKTGIPYEAFRNIPYAKPPIGALKFKNPEILTNYPDELDKKDKPICVQVFLPDWSPRMYGAEDCLYLHVYRPRLNYNEVQQNLSVLVHLPMNSLVSNVGDPESIMGGRLMNDKIIVVIVQFRVNVLGYLSLGDNYIPGNFGLKDRFLAISWVKAGIRSFGGSPDKITLFGDASVMYQMMQTRINFQQAIISSNYAFSHFKGVGALTKEEGTGLAYTLGLRLGYGNLPKPELLARLQKESLKRIIDTEIGMMNHDHFPFYVFGPTIEPVSAFSVLSDHPTKLWAKMPHDIPIMVGFSQYYGEFIIRGLLDRFDCLRTYETYKAIINLLQMQDDKTLALTVAEFYGVKKDYNFFINDVTKFLYSRMFTHRFYEQPLNKTIRLYNHNPNIKRKSLRVYVINWPHRYNEYELAPLFAPRQVLYPILRPEGIVKMFADFVKTGDLPRIASCQISDDLKPYPPDYLCPAQVVKKGQEFVVDYLLFESRFLDSSNITLLD